MIQRVTLLFLGVCLMSSAMFYAANHNGNMLTWSGSLAVIALAAASCPEL